MAKSTALYLSAREASAELAISPATLYAYVSRGLIRSEPSSDSRSHRYRAEDVRGLKERRTPSPEPRGLKSFDADLPVMDSAISTITEDGPIYRGVNCIELAEADTLEHAATLLWDVTGADPFSSDNCPHVSAEMRGVAEAARDAAPIDRTIAVLALAASADPRAFTRAADGRALVGGRILRLVVATMLNGPKHGGAGVLAAQLVKMLVDRDVAPVIRERVALGERFAGFGHGVYKHGDPRAHALLDALARAGAAEKLTTEIPERILEATGEFVNIDYALAVLVHTLGLPPGHELVLFAMTRTVGWIAH